MKSGFWKSDWFLGLALALLVFFASGSDLLQSLERTAYDMGVQASSRTPSDRVAVIAIDDESIANIGRWPWPRDVHAKMIDLLAAAKAKVIGYSVFFSEPQIDPGYRYIPQLLELARKPAAGTPEGDAMAPMVQLLTQAEASLNTDRKLADSAARAGDVMLPMLFTLGRPQGRPDRPRPQYVQKNVVPNVKGEDDGLTLPAAGVQIQIESIGAADAGVGHLNANPDVDGSIRTEPLVGQYFGQSYPSLAMLIADSSRNLGPADRSLSVVER